MEEQPARGGIRVKRGLAEMLRGGVIMDVVNAEQAKIAENAGAVSVMALERVPSDIRHDGGVARMSDPELIEGIQAAVTIPVMAKARIGHFVEAQVLAALDVDYIDESEVLTPADEANHIDKWEFDVPFVCGATNLGEALRRISEGAALIRSKGEAGTGNIVEAVRHLRSIKEEIARLTVADDAELYRNAKELAAPYELVKEVAETGALPVPLFCAGGIATPADAALAMQLGAEAVFVGSGIFKSSDPPRYANAIVAATTHYEDAAIIAKVSMGLGEAMRGDEMSTIDVEMAKTRLVKVGVLSLQGDSHEHLETLHQLGIEPIAVKQPEQLDDIEALVLPGGESTTISKLMDFAGFFDPLAKRTSDGTLAVMGTCAGMILSAKTIVDGRDDQRSLGIFDAVVRRNAEGRQKFSFEVDVQIKGLDEPFPMVFIRGPGVDQTGPEVEVLAEWDGRPALCAQGRHMFATFHPELTKDGRIHKLFLERL